MARPPAEEAPESILLQAFTGLRNTVAAERLGPSDLEVAINIDLDDVGQARRRRGYTLVDAAQYHSLFEAERGVFVVKGGRLGRLYPDYSFQEILEDAGTAAIDYVEVAETIYFTSEDVTGKILPDDTFAEWGDRDSAGLWISPVVNPTPTLNPVRGRLLQAPPVATWLAHLNARIYLAAGKTLWATEPFLYDHVDKNRNFMQFEHEITGVRAVTDGLYVGTTDGVWFLGLQGMVPPALKRTRVSHSGCVPGSMVRAPSDMVGKDTPTQTFTAVAMMTEAGVCAGFDNGVFAEVTDSKVWLPRAGRVAPLLREQDGVKQYVAVANNGGSPTAAARIGDFVEAEIRRFQG